MPAQENNAYILGTDEEELYRLGLQHQLWAEEAQHGWKLAKFNHPDRACNSCNTKGKAARQSGYYCYNF